MAKRTPITGPYIIPKTKKKKTKTKKKVNALKDDLGNIRKKLSKAHAVGSVCSFIHSLYLFS